MDATRLLELWEVTGGVDAVERALALAVAGGQARENLLDRPYGATNAAVWAFRTQWLGSHLDGLATCASCGERVEFAVESLGLVTYESAWQRQRERHAAVVANTARDTVWLLEHEPVYTAGRRTEPFAQIGRAHV